MIGLCLKFHGAMLIRSMFNKAKFKVEEVQVTRTRERRRT